jgi:hypothetical protein
VRAAKIPCNSRFESRTATRLARTLPPTSTPQTIAVVGIDDFVAGGNQPYTIATNLAESADLGCAGLNPADASCSNQDND